MLATMEWMPIANLIVSVGLTIAVAWLGTKQRRIDTLEERVIRSTDEQLERRFEAVNEKCLLRCDPERNSDLMTSIKVLSAELANINRRLERGDGQFDTLGEGSHKQELRTQAMVSELKDWVLEKSASKDDLRALNDRFTALQLAVARGQSGVIDQRMYVKES